MKRYIFPLLMGILLIASCGPGKDKKENGSGNDKPAGDISGTLKIEAGNAVYALSRIWATEFAKAYPKVVTDVHKSDGMKALRALLTGKAQAAIIERPLTAGELSSGLWAVPVAKDALLPVINFDNQHIQSIVMSGLNKKQLADIFTGKAKSWAALYNKKSIYPLKAYILQDSCGSSDTWAQFLGIGATELKGGSCTTDQEVIQSITQSPFSIGFCSMIFLYNNTTGILQKGLYIPPVDFNDNGQADDSELFYDKWPDLKQAINTGKYPSPPTREMYLVLKEKPKDKMLKEFVNWVLTIGQNYTDQQGYIFIPKEKAAQLIKTME
ncbi:MAG: substrate-binding domain-containing protein [Bacteroidota bacterium]